MKFGLSYNTGFYGTDPDQMIAVARHAEQCGFESFYFPEHIALYPGASVGRAGLRGDGYFSGGLTAAERATQLGSALRLRRPPDPPAGALATLR
jgi:hypothetical protein